MKALAVIINFFVPGVGSLFIGQFGQGIAQLLIWLVGLSICFTVIGVLIGAPLMFVAWLWAVIGAATSNPAPIQVQVNHTNTTGS